MKFHKMILIFMVPALWLAACNPSQDNFSVYIVAEDIPHDVVVKGDIENLQLETQPLLTAEDILWYDTAAHEMELTEEAFERIAELNIPVAGGPNFVVCVGSERIYGGAFWTPLSSLSFDGVVIQPPLGTDNHTVRFQLSYPESPDLFKGQDLRADARIIQALRQAGKLRE